MKAYTNRAGIRLLSEAPFNPISFIQVLLTLLITLSPALAQDPPLPPRGFHPAGSYSLGDVESINNLNGNMNVNIPLASLPPGRGGHPGSQVSLYYNSKILDTGSFVGGSGTEYVPFESPDGGWRYNFRVELDLKYRWEFDMASQPPCPNNQAKQVWQLYVVLPDGSSHLMRAAGFQGLAPDGWDTVAPDGLISNCGQGPLWTFNTVNYYSVDGTYLRLEVYHDDESGAWTDNSWTLYFPDGRRVTFNEPGAEVGTQRIYDRNNNYIEIRSISWNDNPATEIRDQVNRSIVVEYAGDTDKIYETGAYGESLLSVVHWKDIWVSKDFYQPSDPSIVTGFVQRLRAVWKIDLPSQGGALSWEFAYNCTDVPTYPTPTIGWGELSSIKTPSGAQTAYQYGHDDIHLISADLTVRNYVSRKTLSYRLEYDGQFGDGAPLTSEVWEYLPASANFNEAQVKDPDQGLVKELFDDFSKLSWRTEYPDGRMTERVWQYNRPFGSPYNLSQNVNPLVKTELQSVKDAVGNWSKTAIKDFKYDKNGNVREVAEYDWVAYGSIPRDVLGRPTGIPGGLTAKRVTVNTYNNATPDASNTTIDDGDVYHKPGSPNIKRSMASSETRSGSGSTVSRSESFYDNPATTGNLTLERRWDSAKGGISDPLDDGNSISVSHQYDSFGNRTHTTDANNVTTWFIYGEIDGPGSPENLYVTETKVANNTPVQQWTMRQYDLHTGLVKESIDMDNIVTTRTTFDVFGRTILVEEADGIAGFEKHTATQYSDTQRRVIVRSDLNTTGEGKLISIQHYDQLGRLRLTRKLESGNPLEATDETKGVKIQTRYFAGNVGNENGYELVSAPYRAATSGAAGGEPGMAWKRTKFDQDGKVIEVETFVGASPPAPWGSNSVSSGKFTTEHDAEFTTVTDQAGKKRRSRLDGLGRLVRVDEPDSAGNLGGTTAPVQPTDYAYNVLDNLIQTSQTGVPNGGSTQVTQIRTFTFSSLGRLITANNPESGLISHEYDDNGNLKKKTEARGIVIDYTYDDLNRNLTVDYSNTAVSPDISRFYDNPAAGAYGKGKFWHDYAGGNWSVDPNIDHTAVDNYDPLGRPLNRRQLFKHNGAVTGFSVSQTYDLAGHVKTRNYPSGRSVTYTYDVAGDLTGFSGNIGDGVPRTYSTGIQYNPQGQMTREQFGTATPLYHRRHYNSRGQLFDIRLGADGSTINDGPNPAQWTGASWNRGALRSFFSSNLIEYSWPAVSAQNNNGNLHRQDHLVPTALDVSGNVTAWVMGADYYCYDTLNRVTLAAEEYYTSAGGYTSNVFNEAFTYDRFGNKLTGSAFGTGVPNPGYKINGANNRLIAPTDVNGSQTSDKIRYDAAGNMIKDTHTQSGTGARTYDAENRMLTADGANGLANSYTYDANGRRTRRSINGGGEVWWHVYGIDGELLGEYQLISGTATLKKEYGYRNSQLLVIADTTGTCKWLVTDALGTPRIIANQTGSLAGVERRDYLAFGGQILAGIGHRQPATGYPVTQSQQPRQQFTGKERDSETGLDYFEARYYSSLQGRFTSPDEFTGGPDELYDFADNAGDNPLLYAEKGEPQSLNKYQYAYNNPLVYTDIDGHKGWDLLKQGLELATWVPGPIGQGASAARAVIAVAEGDYQGALEYGAGALGGKGGQLLVKGISKAAKAVDKLADGAKALDKVKDVASTAKRAGAACCFAEGTKVATPDGQVNIEQLRVGDKVKSTLLDFTKTDGWTAVNTATWRLIKLRMPNPDDGSDVFDIELLRPLDWIAKTGVAKGFTLEVEFSEINLRGKAEVIGVSACPKIKPGPGRVVLSTLTHRSPQLMEVRVEGLDHTLEPTATHPFFSEDRRDWVLAGDLRIGEMVRTKECPARITEITRKPGRHRVYNIEVEADHTYFVTKLGVLVHNTCNKAGSVLEPRPKWWKSTSDKAWAEAPVNEAGRKVCPTCSTRLTRTGKTANTDNDHIKKTWANRKKDLAKDPNLTRRKVIEEFQKDVRAQCASCNRSHKFEPEE